MKKVYLFLLMIISMNMIATAQQNNQDVVYLKNGSIIRGMIIEQIPNKTIKIETVDKNVFVYRMDEIEKVTKEPIQGSQPQVIEDNPIKVNTNTALQKGYQLIIDVGPAVDLAFDEDDCLKLNIINGYRFNPYFSVGLGTGLKFYLFYDDLVWPVFLDLKVNFMNKKISPYLAVDAGISWYLTDGFPTRGLLLNPSVGVNLRVFDHLAVNLGLGYEFQKDIEYYDVHSLNLNIGITY